MKRLALVLWCVCGTGCGGGADGTEPMGSGGADGGVTQGSGGSDVGAMAGTGGVPPLGTGGAPRLGTGGSAGGAAGGAGGASVPGTGGVGGATSPPPTTWTILVYGSGDNSLSQSLLTDITEMAAARFGSNVHVLVLADWDASQTVPGQTAKFPTGSFWYRIPGTGGPPIIVDSSAELDFDDPGVLTAAVAYAFRNYPATRYGIVLWDHGGGWSGGFGSDSQNNTRQGVPINAEQVASAVQAGLVSAGVSGTLPLEFFSYDACLLGGAEVASTVVGLSKVFISNAEIDYGAGWDYTAALTWIGDHVNGSAVEFAVAEVQTWNAQHVAGGGVNDLLLRSHVAIDLTKVGPFQVATKAFGDAVKSQAGGATALSGAFTLSAPGYAAPLFPAARDFGQILRGVKTRAGGAVATAADGVLAAISQMRIAVSNGSLRTGQDGFSILGAPILDISAGLLQSYGVRARTWSQSSGWDGLMQFVHAAADGTPPTIAGTLTVPPTPGPGNWPHVDFQANDPDVLTAERFLAQRHPSLSGVLLLYGYLGTSVISPGGYTFSWTGLIPTIPANPSSLLVTLKPWALASTINGLEIPIFSVKGEFQLSNASKLDANLLYDAQTGIATAFVLGEIGGGAVVQAFSLGDVRALDPNALFVPHLDYVNVNTGASGEVPLTVGVRVPPSGSLSFAWAPAQAGTYDLFLEVHDVWGNVGSDDFGISLTGPIAQ